MAKSDKKSLDGGTEARIKHAARKVFLEKGYAATRVRDIAEESGLNLALLNYYFRSKEKLFDLVMQEKFHEFVGIVQQVVTSELTSLPEKVQQIANSYIDLLLSQPDLPVFLFNELRLNPEKMPEMQYFKQALQTSPFNRQLREHIADLQPHVDPFQFLLSLLGLIVFPFVARPMVQTIAGLDDAAFAALMHQRKYLVPQWFAALLTAT